MVRAQVYQTKDPRFKTIRWLKNCLSISSFKSQSNEYRQSLGTWWLKVSPHCDSAVYRQLNSIHKVVHWGKWTLKMGPWFFVKYTWSILLKYSGSVLKVYLKYTYSILLESTLKIYLKNNWSMVAKWPCFKVFWLPQNRSVSIRPFACLG